MNKKNELQVKPVKRYRKPKYPSHEDPDPTLHPQPIPYPASRKLISALATSAGMAVTASCAPPTLSPAADSLPDGNSTLPAGGDTETLDPFDGPDGDPFGDAIAEDPFGDAGGNSSANQQDSAINNEPNSHHDSAREQEFAEIIEVIEQTITPDEWEDVGGPGFISTYPGHPATKAKTAQQAIDEAGGNPLCVALSGLPHQTSGFGTGMPNYIQADLARRVIERVFKNAGYQLRPNHPYDRDGVAMVLDGYDEQKKVGFVVGDWKNLDNDAVLLWWAPPSQVDGKKYEAEINTLVQSIGNDPEHKQLLSDVQAAKKQADPARRSAAYKAILAKHRKSLLSLKEMIELEKRGKQGEEYIAVISTYDTRFALPSFTYITPSEQAEINKIADPGKRNAATKALTEQKAKAGVEALEKAAREYIQWAQRQGLN